jgi:hypothetical protein
VIVTHGSTGDLTRGELPLFAASAAAVGVPCLRFTCTSQDIPVRARAMQELMLRAPDVHPALASVARWVVGGRSLGARTAALVAYTRGLTPDELNNGVDPELDEGERAMARRMAEAGVEVAGAVLSAFPVHMPDTPVRAPGDGFSGGAVGCCWQLRQSWLSTANRLQRTNPSIHPPTHPTTTHPTNHTRTTSGITRSATSSSHYSS